MLQSLSHLTKIPIQSLENQKKQGALSENNPAFEETRSIQTIEKNQEKLKLF